MFKHIRYFCCHASVFILISTSQPAFGQSDLGEWQARALLPTARQEIPHAVLNGKIYVPGGFTVSRSATNAVEVFDPSTNDWSTAPSLPVAMHHLHLEVANGKLYVLGGYVGSTFAASNRVFELNPQAASWVEKSNMPTSRGAAVAVTVDDKIYVIGGSAGGASGLNEMYDPVADGWTGKASMPTSREHLAGAAINSKIYIVGGRTAGFTNKTTLEVYSPETDSWQSLAPMPTARGGLAAAAANGRLYVFGGEFIDTDMGTTGVFDETEEYDPATNTWRQLHPMLVPRHGIGAAVVDNHIYIIGGGPVAGFGVSQANTVFAPPMAVTGVRQDDLSPAGFELLQNYPNPFNPETRIRFDVPSTVGAAVRIRVSISNIRGQVVRVLFHDERSPGSYEISWDGRDDKGTQLPSGIYLYTIRFGEIERSKKMLLVK